MGEPDENDERFKRGKRWPGIGAEVAAIDQNELTG